MRKCRYCERTLKLDEFYKKQTKAGLDSVCKKCRGVQQSIADRQARKKTEPFTLIEFEVFKEFKPNYLVSNLGRAYVKEHYCGNGRFIRGKFLKLTKLKSGYPCIGYNRTKYTVHRIVAELFVQNPNGLSHVNHKDRVRHNNHFTNLEWCTHQENVTHATKLGSYAKKLDEQDVMSIRESKESPKYLAEKYQVSNTNITYIINRKIWKHI